MATKRGVPDVQFESTGNRARSAGSGGPGNAGFNNTATSDVGAGFAVLAELAAKTDFERDNVTGVKVEMDGAIKRDADVAALDPLAPDHDDRVKAIVEDSKKTVLESSGISNSAVKDELSKRLDRSGATVRIAAQHIRQGAVRKETERVAGESVDMVASKVRNDPANANAYMSQFEGDMALLKVGMDPARVPAFAAAAADIFAKNQVIGFAEKGNIGAARAALKEHAQYFKGETVTGISSYIDGRESKLRADGERVAAAADTFAKNQVIGFAEKGDIGAARGAMKEQAQYLKGPTVASLSSYIDGQESKLRAEAERAKTANATTMLLDVEDQYNGKKPIDPNNREKFDAMKERGDISPEHHLTLVKMDNNERTRYNVEANKDAVAAEQLATGTLSSQENADRGFSNQFGNVPFGRIAMQGTPEQKARAIQLSTAMASESGYLPTPMKNLISNSDSITNPQQFATVAFAAEAMDDIEAKAPGKLAGVDLKDTGVVNRVRVEAKRLMLDGVPRQEAYVQAAQTQMPKDAITVQGEKDLREVATEALKKIKPVEEAKTAVTSFLERNIPFITTPEVSATMGQVYERVFKDAMVATNGNVERAKALAAKKISDTYGPTKVGVLDATTTTTTGTTAPAYDNETTMYEIGNRTSDGMTGQGRVTIQAYPPEKYMARAFPTLNQDQLAKMAMHELGVINKKFGIAPNPSKDAAGLPVVRLFADAQTADDIRRGLPPSYQYQILRGDLYEPIATSNGPLRYRIPTTVDQVKDNPVYMEAERNRLTRDQKARDNTIERGRKTVDDVADERVKRMMEEGRGLKGNR